MQSVPESRQQSFEEIYGPPENFLEIEVSHPVTSSEPYPEIANLSQYAAGLVPISLSPLIKPHTYISTQTPRHDAHQPYITNI
jgi:hypothetical protein